MKFYISIAVNVALAIGIVCLMIKDVVGGFYYRDVVGKLVFAAAAQLKSGEVERVHGALSSVPPDPNYNDIVEAYEKLGVVKK